MLHTKLLFVNKDLSSMKQTISGYFLQIQMHVVDVKVGYDLLYQMLWTCLNIAH